MNLLKKLTKKNLLLNKKRTIVTIIGIILSVSLITAVSSLYVSLINSLISFETSEQGNFHVAFYDVPINDLENFQNNRSVEEIFLTKNIGYAKLDNSKNPNKPYIFIKGFSQKSLENLGVKLVDGRLPERENEVVIPTHLKTNGRVTYNIGDTLILNVGDRVSSDGTILTQNDPYIPDDSTEVIADVNGKILESNDYSKSKENITNTKSITYKIVGIIERPPYNVESYSAPGYTFITLEKDSEFNSTVDVYARYTKSGIKNNLKITAGILGFDEDLFILYHSGEVLSESESDKILYEIDHTKYKFQENNYLIKLENDPIKDSSIGGLGVVVAIVCLIIIVTSVFCIKNSFDISVSEKTKQYGMLRSIGATKKQIKKNVFYEATILGIIGIPLGILAGLFASYILIIVSNYFLSTAINGRMLTFSFSIIAIILATIIGIITIYLSAIRSARKASKVSPIESIRNSADIKIKAKKIKCPKIIKNLFGIGGEISYKNLKRNKRKYRTTVISIVVSVATFIALSSFMNMAFDTVKNQFKEEDFNIYVYLENNDAVKKIPEITSLDNIEEYAIQREYQAEIQNVKINKKHQDLTGYNNDTYRDLQIMAIGNEAYQKYLKKLGLKYEQVKDKGILLDRVLYSLNNKDYRYRMYDYQKDDVISFIGNDKNFDLPLALITDENPFSLSTREYESIVIVSDELWDKYYTLDDRGYLYIKSNDASKLQDNIDEILKEDDYYLNNTEEDYNMMHNLFTLIGIFLYGFIIVISLIGITNIFNTITTSMELRRQEFAMLKSIGMTKREFNRMIRLESIFMGLKSLLFGIPIGLILSYLIFMALKNETGIYNVPIQAILITIIFVFLLITCIMKYSMSKINKQNTIETIRNENI